MSKPSLFETTLLVPCRPAFYADSAATINQCLARSPVRGFWCTRPSGHTEAHEAGKSNATVCARWEDAKPEEALPSDLIEALREGDPLAEQWAEKHYVEDEPTLEIVSTPGTPLRHYPVLTSANAIHPWGKPMDAEKLAMHLYIEWVAAGSDWHDDWHDLNDSSRGRWIQVAECAIRKLGQQ